MTDENKHERERERELDASYADYIKKFKPAQLFTNTSGFKNFCIMRANMDHMMDIVVHESMHLGVLVGASLTVAALLESVDGDKYPSLKGQQAALSEYIKTKGPEWIFKEFSPEEKGGVRPTMPGKLNPDDIARECNAVRNTVSVEMKYILDPYTGALPETTYAKALLTSYVYSMLGQFYKLRLMMDDTRDMLCLNPTHTWINDVMEYSKTFITTMWDRLGNILESDVVLRIMRSEQSRTLIEAVRKRFDHLINEGVKPEDAINAAIADTNKHMSKAADTLFKDITGPGF